MEVYNIPFSLASLEKVAWTRCFWMFLKSSPRSKVICIYNIKTDVVVILLWSSNPAAAALGTHKNPVDEESEQTVSVLSLGT